MEVGTAGLKSLRIDGVSMPSRRSELGLGFEGVAAGLVRLDGVCVDDVSALRALFLFSFFGG